MSDLNVIKIVMEATDQELMVLGQLIRTEREKRARESLKVGVVVRFQSKSRGMQEGEVKKINRKSVKVKVGSVNWSVSPSLLEVVA